MIKQYLDYKKIKVEEMLNSPSADINEKKRVAEEFEQFMKGAFNEQYPEKIILNNMMIKELIELAKTGEIPLVMDKFDTTIMFGDGMPNSNDDKYPFKKISDLVAVHKTEIPPQQDTIFTKENNDVFGEVAFVDPSTGINHKVPYASGSDTIHFTLNCVVENHHVGNDWDSYEYAVMIDLDKLDKSKILDVKSEDTYIDGNAELGNDYILFCPIGKRDEIQEANPHAMIVEYDGISLNEAVLSMMAYSGKKIETYGSFGWDRNSDFLPPSADNECLDELLAEKDYPNLKGEYGALLHSESKYMARRMWKREYEAIISLIEYNKENNINMPESVMIQLLLLGGAYATPGLLNVSVEQYKEFVLPILEKHGYSIENNLFEGISDTESGEKSISFSDETRLNGVIIPDVYCPRWENELRHRVIDMVMKYKKDSVDDNNKGSIK